MGCTTGDARHARRGAVGVRHEGRGGHLPGTQGHRLPGVRAGAAQDDPQVVCRQLQVRAHRSLDALLGSTGEAPTLGVTFSRHSACPLIRGRRLARARRNLRIAVAASRHWGSITTRRSGQTDRSCWGFKWTRGRGRGAVYWPPGCATTATPISRATSSPVPGP